MNSKSSIIQIKEACKTLISCQNDFNLMKRAVDIMYGIFREHTRVDIHDLSNGEINLPSGKAISPSAAAHCLLEMKRTAVFLRGIKKAIDLEIGKSNEAVHILYAGCGPYATLLTPLLTLYNPRSLKITLLDINSCSLYAVKKLFLALSLDKFIDEYVLEDATEFLISKEYNIVISETMQSCLKNEPQVGIMQNIIPQLSPRALFIPQRISIDAYLRNPGSWNDSRKQRTGMKYKFLKALFHVSRENLDSNRYRKVIEIPETLDGFIELVLYTTITVFKGEELKPNDCSLNLPVKYYDLSEQHAGSIEFWYSFFPRPGIKSKVLNLN